MSLRYDPYRFRPMTYRETELSGIRNDERDKDKGDEDCDGCQRVARARKTVCEGGRDKGRATDEMLEPKGELVKDIGRCIAANRFELAVGTGL